MLFCQKLEINKTGVTFVKASLVHSLFGSCRISHSLAYKKAIYMSRFANNALLGGGVRVRENKEQKEIKGTTT